MNTYGCCTPTGAMHRFCKFTEGSDCGNAILACDRDASCQGYFYYPMPGYCAIATTTSPCPAGSLGPYFDGVVGTLDPSFNCGEELNTACYFKSAGPLKSQIITIIIELINRYIHSSLM